MKKILPLMIFTSLMTISCSKTYQCECVHTENGVEIARTSGAVKGKKSDAKTECDSHNYSNTGTVGVCTLK